MQVRSCRISCRTYLCDHFALLHLLPDRSQKLGTVHIHRVYPAAVIDHNVIAS